MNRDISKIAMILFLLNFLPQIVNAQSTADLRAFYHMLSRGSNNDYIGWSKGNLGLTLGKNSFQTQYFPCTATWNDVNISNIPTTKKEGFISYIMSGVNGYGTLKIIDTDNSLLFSYKTTYKDGTIETHDNRGHHFTMSESFCHKLFDVKVGNVKGFIDMTQKQGNYINLIKPKVKINLYWVYVQKIEYGVGSYLEVDVDANNLYFDEYLQKKHHFRGRKTNADGSIEIGKFLGDEFIEGLLVTAEKDSLMGETDEKGNFIVSKIINPRDKWIKTSSSCEIFCVKCTASEITWTGGCLNGKANGIGIAKRLDYNGQIESTYEGNLTNGKRNGIGKCIWPDGSKYEGKWVNGVWEGNGTYFWTDNSKYVGQFKNNYFNGLGTSFWPNGKLRSKGTFKEDYLFNGTQFYEDGTIEYTVVNGVKKLSSAAERIAKLEAQISENKSNKEAYEKAENDANERVKQADKDSWENQPCLIVIEEKDWRSYGFGSDTQKDYNVTVAIPVYRNGSKTYRERTGKYFYRHTTKGIIDRESWDWGVAEPSSQMSGINSEYDAQKVIMNQLGCKSWANR